jgi:hypothetical protein
MIIKIKALCTNFVLTSLVHDVSIEQSLQHLGSILHYVLLKLSASIHAGIIQHSSPITLKIVNREWI